MAEITLTFPNLKLLLLSATTEPMLLDALSKSYRCLSSLSSDTPLLELACRLLLQNQLFLNDNPPQLDFTVVDTTLTSLNYKYRLSSQVLDYPLPSSPTPLSLSPLYKSNVRAFDDALSISSFEHLKSTFSIDSSYWSSHNYNDGSSPDATPSPYFSYVVDVAELDETTDATLLAIKELFCKCSRDVTSAIAGASQIEFWAHKRPHSSGHQFHFDSDNEGCGGEEPKHPIASAVLYLTGEQVGGPTLVTPQRPNSRKCASEGWLVFPKTNRLSCFDGSVLHGVVPGKGVAAGGLRITLMFAFWKEDIRVRVNEGGKFCAAMKWPPPDLPTKKSSAESESESESTSTEALPIQINQIFQDIDATRNKKEGHSLRRVGVVPYEQIFQF